MHGLNIVCVVCCAMDLERDLCDFKQEGEYWCEHWKKKLTI